MKCYVIEFKADDSFISRIIAKVTGKKYTHTAIFIHKIFFELDAVDDPDYNSKVYKGIEHFLKTNPEKDRTEAYKMPYEFTNDQCKKGVKFWASREKKSYGYFKLLTFLWLVPMRPFMAWYYRKKGKPYSPKINAKGTEVCSVAVDKCLKEMGFDAFPEYEERVTYPGLFAEKFKKYKMEV